jgi:hypothetical protein
MKEETEDRSTRPSGRSATIWISPLANKTVHLQTNLPNADWARVDGESVAAIGHGFVAHDYYPPLSRYYWYTATAGTEVVTSVPVHWMVDSPRIFDIGNGDNVPVVVRTQRPLSWASRSALFDVLQSDPVAVVSRAFPSTATLVLRVAVADRVPLHRLLKTGRVLALRSPCTDAVYDTIMLPKSWTMEDENASDPQGFVTVKIDYQTVHEDIQPTQHLPDWMLVTILEKYATMDALQGSYATMDALRIGPG